MAALIWSTRWDVEAINVHVAELTELLQQEPVAADLLFDDSEIAIAETLDQFLHDCAAAPQELFVLRLRPGRGRLDLVHQMGRGSRRAGPADEQPQALGRGAQFDVQSRPGHRQQFAERNQIPLGPQPFPVKGAVGDPAAKDAGGDVPQRTVALNIQMGNGRQLIDLLLTQRQVIKLEQRFNGPHRDSG